MIEAVLFDMDGVLVDSEKYIAQAAKLMFAEQGLQVNEEDFLPFVGTGEDRYLGGVAEKYNFPINIERDKARTYAIYVDLVEGTLEPLPGAQDFINTCREKRLKVAVATSADYIKMIANLNGIGIPASEFDLTINGLEIERKKPFPDIYLAAAGGLGVAAQNCLVVEDAVKGVEAAKAAGCKCLALTTSFTREQLAGADWYAENLAFAPNAALTW